jgi:hypothetical protein
MPSLLEWMTPRLAEEAALQQARQAREARADHPAATAVRSPDAGS